jgi:protein-disulfide isomerase
MATLKTPVTSRDHIQGRADAAITLVEYGDYECPHCERAYYIIQKLQDHFSDQLRFVFRNFPLSQVHPLAEPAAEVAEFAGTRELFWEMHDAIYENQRQLSVPALFELAESLDLSAAEVQQALETHEFLPRVKEDFLGGVKSGVNGTPTFFINGLRHDGAYEFENLISAIDLQLSQIRPAA